MKQFKSIPAFLLLLAAALTAVACGEGGNAPAETKDTAAGTETAEQASPSALDLLPAHDFGGVTVNFLLREEVDYEFTAEQSGEVVEDAVYRRNADIRERYDLNVNYIGKPGLWTSVKDFQGVIRASVMAGDGDYDIVTGQSNIITPLASEGMYIDLAKSEYIDSAKPYWRASYADNAAMFGKLYTVVGDYALTSLTQSQVVFFNRRLQDAYDMPDLYKLVRDGKWTLDAFESYVKDMPADLNGDNEIRPADDLLGFNGVYNSMTPFFIGAGLSLVTDPADGVRSFDGFPSEKAIALCDRMKDLVAQEKIENISRNFKDYESECAALFASGNLFLYGDVLEMVEKLRDMEDNFGIIPYPKYDEAQKDYRTRVLRKYTVASVPTTAEHPDEAQFLLEAMSAAGRDSVLPAYYEIALKHKYVREEGAEDILDMISQSACFDFTDIYYSDLDTIVDFMATYAINGQSGAASVFEQKRSSLESKLAKLYDSYRKE